MDFFTAGAFPLLTCIRFGHIPLDRLSPVSHKCPSGAAGKPDGQVTSGITSAATSKFISATGGFASVFVSQYSMTTRFFDSTGALLYEAVSNQKRYVPPLVEEGGGKDDGSNGGDKDEGNNDVVDKDGRDNDAAGKDNGDNDIEAPGVPDNGDGEERYDGRYEDDGSQDNAVPPTPEPGKGDSAGGDSGHKEEQGRVKKFLVKVFSAMKGNMHSDTIAVLLLAVLAMVGFVSGVLLLAATLMFARRLDFISPANKDPDHRGTPTNLYRRSVMDDIEGGSQISDESSSPPGRVPPNLRGENPYVVLSAPGKPKPKGPDNVHSSGAVRVSQSESEDERSSVSDSLHTVQSIVSVAASDKNELPSPENQDNSDHAVQVTVPSDDSERGAAGKAAGANIAPTMRTVVDSALNAAVEIASAIRAAVETVPAKIAGIEASPPRTAAMDTVPARMAAMDTVPRRTAALEPVPAKRAALKTVPPKMSKVEQAPTTRALGETVTSKRAAIKMAPAKSSIVEAAPIDRAAAEAAPNRSPSPGPVRSTSAARRRSTESSRWRERTRSKSPGVKQRAVILSEETGAVGKK